MSLSLSDSDLEFIEGLKSSGVLQDIQEHLIDQTGGCILVTCADGDRFPDIFEHQLRLQKPCREDPRIHPLSWHGGGLACAVNSQVNSTKGADRIFRAQIHEAPGVKNNEMTTLAFLAHWPCGAALRYDIDLGVALNIFFDAKRQVRRENPLLSIHPFFHIDYGIVDGKPKKKTYFLSREHWEKYVSLTKK
jgi:hypothetical protein